MTDDSSKPDARELTKTAASIGISLVVHAGIIAILAMITWVIIAPTPRAVVVSAGGGGGERGSWLGAPIQGAQNDATAKPQAAMTSQRVNVTPAPPTQLSTTGTLQPPAMNAPPGFDPAMAMFEGDGNPGQGGGEGRGVGTGRGPGVGAGDGPGFGDVVGDMKRRGLDVVFVIDATSSMSPYIGQAKSRLVDVVNVIQNLVGDKPDAVRFGLVAFKDYGDDYGISATRATPITPDPSQFQRALDDVVAGGGADVPEPLHDALAAATARKMKWDRSRKNVIILITDAPCHALGRAAAAKEATDFAKSLGGQINVIDVGAQKDGTRVRESVLEDLQNIARAGGGSAFLLEDEAAFWQHMVISMFGQRYAGDVNAIIEKYVKSKKP